MPFTWQARKQQAATQRWSQGVQSAGGGGGTSGGGGGTSMQSGGLQNIIAQMQASQQKANLLTEQRYKMALDEQRQANERMRTQFGSARESLATQFGAARESFATMGQTAMQDVNRGAKRSEAQQQQRLIGSGLSGTTITSAVSRGVESDRRRAMGAIEERKAGMMGNLATQQAGMFGGLAQQQAGFEMQAGGALTGLMASRQDIGPDMGMFTNLLQTAGQGQGQSQQRVMDLGSSGGGGGSSYSPMSRQGGGGTNTPGGDAVFRGPTSGKRLSLMGATYKGPARWQDVLNPGGRK